MLQRCLLAVAALVVVAAGSAAAWRLPITRSLSIPPPVRVSDPARAALKLEAAVRAAHRVTDSQVDRVLATAEDALEAGAGEEALALLWRAAALRPDDIRIMFMAAQGLDVTGRTAVALQAYETLIAQMATMPPGQGEDANMWAMQLRYVLQKILVSYVTLRQPVAAQQAFAAARTALPQAVHWRSGWQVPSTYDPQLRAQPWHNASEYKDLRVLQASYTVVRAELDAFLAQHEFDHLMEDYSLQSKDGAWREVMLWQHGKFNETSCAHFPRTCALVRDLPSVTGKSPVRRTHIHGEVTFLRLAPGAHLRAHVGRHNDRLTAHLGLIVPEGPVIYVANEPGRTWKEGEVILFDDSFIHEVWHYGTEPRYVLYMSVWHPQLQ